jgi:hypothetical protein
MPEGYSARPLAQKLGITGGKRVLLVNAPTGYERKLGRLPAGVTLTRHLVGIADVIQFFARDEEALRREFPLLRKRVKQDGAIWVSWPKRSSGVETDLDEGLVRSNGLESGLVDTKICAVDKTWSALKFVIRVGDRRRS